MEKIKSNGGLKNPANLDDKQIEFPVTFNLKAVMEGTGKEHKKRILAVFDQFKVKNTFQNKKESSKGTYVSYTFEVELESKVQMEAVYAALKNVEGLKFAL